MGKKKMSVEDFVLKVDNEGLDYAITSRFEPDDVPEEIRDDWRVAREVLSRIDDFLDANRAEE